MSKFLRVLSDRNYRFTAIRVALIVGSALFAINHGEAVIKEEE